eukprot:1940058-Rhodomonas_salina.1
MAAAAQEGCRRDRGPQEGRHRSHRGLWYAAKSNTRKHNPNSTVKVSPYMRAQYRERAAPYATQYCESAAYASSLLR